MAINGVALGALAIGGLFVYGGIMGKSPLTALQAVVQGKSPASASDSQAIDSGPIGGQTDPTPPTTHGDTSPNANRALGKALANQRGWGTGAEWQALDNLWTRESGWSNIAKNKSSGAYGIAQALPPTKYPPTGRESGGSDPGSQITWGLDYIGQRYGDPIKAWQHETSAGWY